jgi:hypothetical protein
MIWQLYFRVVLVLWKRMWPFNLNYAFSPRVAWRRDEPLRWPRR